jgi:signal transduction histidine kinase
MRVTGLAMLQLQDSAGRILSSGHFRNAFDRVEPELPALLAAAAESTALVRALTPEGPLLALARLDAFRVGGRTFTLTGGVAMDDHAVQGLARDPDLSVSLRYPGWQPTTMQPVDVERNQVVREFTLPYVDVVDSAAPRADTARFVVTQSLTTLQALRSSVDLWFLTALGVTAAIAIVAAGWLSARVSRPLSDLASKTAAIDLERLDQDFATDREDEIGLLSRLLGSMTERLRSGTVRLREAERRATVGDLARQVNHDIKNGLIPIRNVVRHLAEVAREDPAALPKVFTEREGTLDTSIGYLDTLARNYARLSPDLSREPCDANAVVQQLVRNSPWGDLSLQLTEGLPMVLADPVVLRRILENLVGNAVESLESRVPSHKSEITNPEAGEEQLATRDSRLTTHTSRLVTITTEPAASDRARVRITVSDTGRGMTKRELDKAFDDFYTTKPEGTGLGLSIVRRLILDLNGTLRVETQPGVGTRVVVELPAVGH